MTTNVRPMKLDPTELLLLAFVTVALLFFLGWQMNVLPSFLTSSVLGVTTMR